MLNDPSIGFSSSLESKVRTPTAKVCIDSHFYLSTDTQNGHVVVDSGHQYAQKFTVSESKNARFFSFFLSKYSGNDNCVIASLFSIDGGGVYTDLANCRLPGIIGKKPKWFTVDFLGMDPLVDTYDYYITLTCIGDTAIRWYLNSNESETYISNTTGLISGGGLSGSNVSHDGALVFKIRSGDHPLAFPQPFTSTETYTTYSTITDAPQYIQKFSASVSRLLRISVYASLISGSGNVYFEFFRKIQGGGPSDLCIGYLGYGQISGVTSTPGWYEGSMVDLAISLSGDDELFIKFSCDTGMQVRLYRNSSTAATYTYNLTDVFDTYADGITNAEYDALTFLDGAFLFKLNPSSQDLYTIPGLQGLSLNKTNKLTSSADITLSNLDGRFDDEQPIMALLQPGVSLSVYLGNGDTYMKKATLFINSVSSTVGKTVSVSLLSNESTLSTQNATHFDSFIGEDFTEVVFDLLKQAIPIPELQIDGSWYLDSGFFLDFWESTTELSGKLFPTTGIVSGTVLEAIQKIADVINYEIYFDENGYPNFVPRSLSSTAVFELDYSKHIIQNGVSISESKQDLINRIRVDNGITIDNAALSIGSVSLISTETGTLSASTKSSLVTVTFPASPRVSIYLDFGGSDAYEERSRYSDEVIVLVTNPNYPYGNFDYSFSVYGAAILNDDTGFLVQEVAYGPSIRVNGIRDFSESNRMFENDVDLKAFCDRIRLFNSYPRQFCNLESICIPKLENGDLVTINHPHINSLFLYKIMGQSISYSNSAKSLVCAYNLEKYPYLSGEDTGDALEDLYI